MKNPIGITKTKLIYNPHAGSKRRINPFSKRVTLEDIKNLLEQYQIPVDYAATRYPEHAIKLARESIKEGYDLVIAAGGDGTIGEVINGLAGSNVTVGILPLGTVMNNARMLAIPLDIEMAVQLIKIRRERKIDLAAITRTGEGKEKIPYYFTEQAGIGLDASLHFYSSALFDKKIYSNIFRIIKTVFGRYNHKAKIIVDDKAIETKAILVTVSNGPLGGLALPFAPQAKLNDHRLTLSIFDLSRLELLAYALRLLLGRKHHYKKIKRYQGEKISIETEVPKMVHADARKYATTPVSFSILANALSVITGFPKPQNSAFKKRTYLDL